MFDAEWMQERIKKEKKMRMKKALTKKTSAYRLRASAISDALYALEKFAEFERKEQLVNDEGMINDINRTYAILKALYEALSDTADVAEKVSKSDNPIAEALETLLQELEKYEEEDGK